MSTIMKLPFYARASLLLIGLYFFVRVLSVGQDIFLPIIYATIIAIAISPVVNFFERKLNRAFSILLILAFGYMVVGVLLFLLASQASRLSSAWPQLTLKFEELLHGCVFWASEYLNISVAQLDQWVDKAWADFSSNSSSAIGLTLTTMGGMLSVVVLTPVYIFMLLYYQPHLIKFVHKLFGVSNDDAVSEILVQTKTIIQSYLAGLFVEFAIVAVLNSVGLLILGFDYAILLGIAGAFLNVIPYLGGAICMAIFAVIAMVTKTPLHVLYVLGMYSIIQFIDNNYIVPKIVGSKVKLNALVCIIVVILGAALWGIPGMFLSIPITAIVKLILDRTKSLEAWGFLLGDTMPPIVKIDIDLKKVMGKVPK